MNNFRNEFSSRFLRLCVAVLALPLLAIQIGTEAKAQSTYCSPAPLLPEELSALLNQSEFFRYSPMLHEDASGASQIIQMETVMRALLRKEFDQASVEKASVLFKLYSYLYWATLLEITDNNAQIFEAGAVYVNKQDLRRYFQNGVPESKPEIYSAIMCMLRCETPEVSVRDLFASPSYITCREGSEN